MASVAWLNQAITLALCEGFIEMVWEQAYRDKPNNKTFADMRSKLKRDIAKAKRLSRCAYTKKVCLLVDQGAARMKADMFPSGSFHILVALGICIELVLFQVDVAGPEKARAYDQVYFRLQEFIRYFDRQKNVDDPRLYDVGDRIRAIIRGLKN